MIPDELPVFVIYRNPRDFPGKWVCRRQVATSAGEVKSDPEPFAVEDSYRRIRARLPYGLTHLDRHPDDDPTIVETWI
jgi:hypothetical protein